MATAPRRTGEFWKADALAAAAQLCQDAPALPLTLWGLRTGALLATDVACTEALQVDRLLLWQAVADGKNFLNQYLRLRIASQMVHGTDRETTASILERLAAGETIEVAGYPLAKRLADGLSGNAWPTWAERGRDASIGWRWLPRRARRCPWAVNELRRPSAQAKT